jgi:hypothetical protein
MASVEYQLEELKKPNPHIVLELHTIRRMIQEADNMNKGLKAVIHRTQAHQMLPGGVPSPPQPAPQPPSAVSNALFAPSGSLTELPAPAVRCPPHAPLQPAHRKKPSQSQAAISTPTPPPVSTVSTPTQQAVTPGITAPCPQIPMSPKGKAPDRRKGPTKANNVETPTPAHTVASTPTSSTPVDAKGGGKRVRDDDIDAPTSGVSSAQPPKRVKSN